MKRNVRLFAFAMATLLPAASAGAMPLISEVFYDAVGSDDGHSFVEIYGDPGMLLDGLVLEGINGSGGSVTHTIELFGVIPLDGLYVLADVDGAGNTLVAEADGFANFDFQNGPDSVQLRDESFVLDAVGYGAFGAGDVFGGEGDPTVDPPAGSSIARWFADVDSDDNAMDFASLATPTPGTAVLAVPEPSTGSLLGSSLGLLGLFAYGRRRRPRSPRRPRQS
jgi:hypothetical protein